MPDRDVPDTYRPLREFVASRGGSRLRLHPTLRDRVVDWCVADWPANCPDDRVEEVLRARIRRRVRTQYGSVIAAILISVIADLIVKLIIEWWKKRNSHRVLMEGWRAQANPDVSSAGDAAQA